MKKNCTLCYKPFTTLFLIFLLLQANVANTKVLEENRFSLMDTASISSQKQELIKTVLVSHAKSNSKLKTDLLVNVIVPQGAEIRYPVEPAIPEIAHGHEAVYLRFLKGVLIYRPTAGSEVGQIILPIAQLMNPLEGRFDLSKCGDAGKYLSISTGYRKGKKIENADKLEIWIVPKFIVEKDLTTTAVHYQPIQECWSSPVGIIWSNGKWDNMNWYDYLATQDFDALSNEESLYEKWKQHQYYTHRTPDFSIARLISMYRIHVSSFFSGPSDTHAQHAEKFYLKF